MEKRYELNGKTWILRPLVLGQWQGLRLVLKRISIPANPDLPGLLSALQDHLPVILATILVEDGKSLSDRFGFRANDLCVPEWFENPEKMAEAATEIAATIDADTTLQIAHDFFFSLDPASLLQNVAATFQEITGKMMSLTETGSKNSSSSFVTETLQNEPGSSGQLG